MKNVVPALSPDAKLPDTVYSNADGSASLYTRVTVVGVIVRAVESSSVMVSVWLAGFDTPPPLTVPETVTALSGASTSLSTAVIVTVPVLVISPAAIVSILLVERLKSPGTAGDTAAADTVTVTSSLEAALSVAVTVLVPPFSEIEAELSSRLTVASPAPPPARRLKSEQQEKREERAEQQRKGRLHAAGPLVRWSAGPLVRCEKLCKS